jgi:hypothetical protein
VTQTSNTLDLERGMFMLVDPREIALSLKQFADESDRRKYEPFRFAIPMLLLHQPG